MHHRLIAFAVVLCALLPASQAAAADRVALVIGNGAYQETPHLENPARDAEAMAATLETLGFQVILRTDVDRRSADQAMGEFISALEGAEIGLLFFAGHGIQIGGDNFLLPVDVSAESEWSLRSSAIEAQRIISEMERRAGVSIVILDACRDNPLVDLVASSSRSAGLQRGLGRMRLSSRGAIIAFAAAAGDTAADGSGEHSPFTQALLAEIGQPNVEVGLMFRRVARRVRDETRGDQHPELLVRLVDEVYLNPVAETATAAQPVVAAAQPSTETQSSTETQPGVAGPVAAQPGAGDVQAAAAAETAGAAEQQTSAAVLQQQAAARGRTATYDRRFFGDRVIHTPPWTGGLTVPRPLGWHSAAATALAEGDDNNSFATAQPVPLAAAVNARITPRGDHEWFRFEAPTAGELRIDVDPAPAELDLYAHILDGDRKEVAGWQGSDGAGRSLAASYQIPAPGTYWVEMSDGSDNAESSTPFVANIDFIAADDPFEPNNSLGWAAPIPATASFRPAIYPRGDHDWYKIWVPEPGLLQLTASDVPDALDVHMRVLDLNKKDVGGWVGPQRAGADTVSDVELPIPGTYVIEVADGSDNASAPLSFKLDVAFRPVSDVVEPNNSIGSAVIVPPSSEHRPAIFPRGDHDWLAVDVDHPGELSLWASNSPDNLDIYLRVLNADNRDVLGWTGPARQGGDVQAYADLPEPGRYFIEMADGSDNASSPDLFDLQLSYVAQADQYEPNNGAVEAAPLTIGGNVPFNILPRGDHDWFRIETPTAGELAILVEEVAADLDIYVRVKNADLDDVLGWTGPPRAGAVTEAIADLPAAGVYYLELTDGSDNARSVQHAVLSTSFTPIAETSEPNNSFSAARPLALGQPYWATILPRGDSDWYLLDAPRAGAFKVVVDEVPEDLDVYVRLHDAEANAGGWYGPPRAGGVTEAELAVPAAGLYRLQVNDGSDNARSPRPYRIQVDFN